MNRYILGKWSRHFYLGRDVQRFDSFSRIVRFGLFKVHTLPPEGALIQWKKHYKGFIFEVRFWWPIDSVQWR